MSDQHEHDDLPSVDEDARNAMAAELFERMGRPPDDYCIGPYTCPECGKTATIGAPTVSGMPMPTFAVMCCGRLIEILPTGDQ